MNSANPSIFDIKKYPNRRFYDVTRSCHVTLDDLYELVKAGNQITVTDTKSGSDITNVVLTQIILEHDPPKLDLFPASLLHQAIQANQQMVRRFVDQYFAQAVDAFAQSRQKFDAFLKQSGFSALQPMAPFDWVRMLFPTMGTAGREHSPPTPASSPGPMQSPSQRQVVEDDSPARPNDVEYLRDEVQHLREELIAMRASKGAKPKKGKAK